MRHMKQAIHPQVYTDTQVLCSCGNSFVTASTKKSITVDVCYKCHPYFTGEHRFIDIKGRVDSFQKKQQVAAQMKEQLENKKAKKSGKTEEQGPKSLRELLNEI